jgi:hypothetical protein
VAKDTPDRNAGQIAFEDVQIRAADGGFYDSHHGVGWVVQRGFWHLF